MKKMIVSALFLVGLMAGLYWMATGDLALLVSGIGSPHAGNSAPISG